MDISEQVLFNSIAQLLRKDQKEAAKKEKKTQEPFEVVSSEKNKAKKVDVQFELEQKLIELLVLYGSMEQEFEEMVIDKNEKGELDFKAEVFESRVFEKIYLDLQDDEIEFANPEFKNIYSEIINRYVENPERSEERRVGKE